MQQFFIFICLIAMVVTSIISVMTTSIIKSAIILALTSASLTIAMFLLGATWAAVFELSVCSGLITVIFISAISLTVRRKKTSEHTWDHRRRFSTLPFLLILVGVALIAVVIATGFTVSPPADSVISLPSTFQNVFWNLRQADVLGQIIVILAGAFAVVVLFKEGNKQ